MLGVASSVEPDKLPLIVDSVDGRSAIRQYRIRIVNRLICARRDGIHKPVVAYIISRSFRIRTLCI